MPHLPTLNLPPVKLRGARRHGRDCVWDGVRGCWLVLTPEEWVRRHVVGWLTGEHSLPPTCILQERRVEVGGMAQRADIVVVDSAQNPLLLVECKAPEVAVDAAVLDQAVRYNSVVGAPCIMLTNGLVHYFYSTADGVSYSALDAVPPLEWRRGGL